MDKLIKLFKFVFRVEFFSYLYFIIRSTFNCLNSPQNKYLLKKTLHLQKHLDKINELLPNDMSDYICKEINEDQTFYKGFSAEIQKDKHGKNNNGITIGYDKEGWNANFKVGL